jgi:hypothetical protein
MVEPLPAYSFDRHGLITQRNGNGGDTAHNEGLYVILTKALFLKGHTTRGLWHQVTKRFKNKVRPKLEVYPGQWRRHPDRSPDWDEVDVRDFARWNDLNVFSREQWLMIRLALGMMDMTVAAEAMDDWASKKLNTAVMIATILNPWGLTLLLLGRWMPNKDILGPQHWAILNRVDGKRKWLQPALDIWLYMAMKVTDEKGDASDAVMGLVYIQVCDMYGHSHWSRKAKNKLTSKYKSLWQEYFGHDNGVPFHIYASPILDSL